MTRFRRAQTLISLGIAAGLGGCRHEPSASEHFAAAKNAAQHHDDQTAVREYTAAAKAGLGDARLYFDRAQSERLLKQNRAAAGDYTAALQGAAHGDHTLAPAFVNLAHYYRGVLRIGQLQWAAAEEDLRIAVRAYPGDWSSWDNLGYARYKLGDYRGAIPDFNKGLAFFPNDANDHFNRGDSLYHTGRATQAVADFSSAIHLSPRWGAAYQMRGLSYFAVRDYRDAEADYTQAIHLIPKAWSWEYRCEARENLGNIKGALGDCNHAISDYPRWSAAYIDRGWAKAQLGAMGGALADMNSAVKYDPQNAAAYKWRGWVRGRMSQYRAAFADYHHALHLAPRYGDARTAQTVLATFILSAQHAGVRSYGIGSIDVARAESDASLPQSEYRQHVAACNGYFSELDSYYQDCVDKGVEQAKNDELSDRSAAEEAESENYNTEAKVQEEVQQQAQEAENRQNEAAQEADGAQSSGESSSGEASNSESNSGEAESNGDSGQSAGETVEAPEPEAPAPEPAAPESGGE